jgi:hypothetical protein
MRLLACLILFLTACAAPQSYQFIKGGDRVSQPGVSFVLPYDFQWTAMLRSTYNGSFGAFRGKDDTLIVGYNVYNLEPFETEDEFLRNISKGRSSEPKTGRFERVRNKEELYTDRTETCMIYRSASKDFGVEARRGGEFTILDMVGMHCVHPIKKSVGVQVELSRKALPGKEYPALEAEALRLLSSVEFGEF